VIAVGLLDSCQEVRLLSATAAQDIRLLDFLRGIGIVGLTNNSEKAIICRAIAGLQNCSYSWVVDRLVCLCDKSFDPSIRIAAAECLGTTMNRKSKHQNTLVSLAMSSDEAIQLRAQAIRSLARISPIDSANVSILSDLLVKDSQTLRVQTLRLLAFQKAVKPAVMNAVIETVDCRDAEVVAESISAAVALDKFGEKTIDALHKCLSHPELLVRRRGLILASLYTKSPFKVADYFKFLSENDEGMVEMAVDQICRFDVLTPEQRSELARLNKVLPKILHAKVNAHMNKIMEFRE